MTPSKTTEQTPELSSRPGFRRRGLLARRPLTAFFFLAYALTWLGWSPWFLSEAGVGLFAYDGGRFEVLFNVAGLVIGPTLSAFVVTGAVEGKEGLRRLLRRILLWRAGPGWYVFVLAGIPAILLLSAAAVPGALASFRVSAVPSALFLYAVAGPFFLFAGGPLFEEIGWRGFALPRLQRRYGPMIGSIVLGVLWALWHLPLFFIPGWDTPHDSPIDIALFVVLAVGISFTFTWVFNNTDGSVLLAVLAHGSLNMGVATAYDLFPTPAVTDGFASFVVGLGVVAVAVIVLTRGRLGYRQGTDRTRPDASTDVSGRRRGDEGCNDHPDPIARPW